MAAIPLIEVLRITSLNLSKLKMGSFSTTGEKFAILFL